MRMIKAIAICISLWITTPLWAANPDTPQAHGAVCDGVADDTSALAAWAAAATTGAALYIPHGTCTTRAAIVFPSVSRISLVGDGSGASRILYTGTNTSNSIVIIGPGGVNCVTQWTIRGISILSNTAMTGGAGLLFNGLCRSDITDIIADGQDGNGNLYIGAWFNGVDRINLRGFDLRGQADALRVNGVTNGPQADLLIMQGKLSLSAQGLHVAGGFGGLIVDQTDIISNNTEVLIDTSLTGTSNRELMFGPGAALDITSGGAGVGLSLLDPGSNSSLYLTGTWVASSQGGDCISLASAVSSWDINIVGGTIFNCHRDGIRNNSSSSSLRLNISNVQFRNVGGYAINSTQNNSNISISGITVYAAALGEISSNINFSSYKKIGPDESYFAPVSTIRGNAIASPTVRFYTPGAPLDQKYWDYFVDQTGGFLQGRAINDTYSAGNTWLTVQKSGTSISRVALGPHFGSMGGTPTVSSCGSGGSIAGNDTSGTVTEGGTASGCTITFAQPFNTTPDCVISSPNANPSLTSYTYTISSTVLKIFNNSGPSFKFSYICIGG